MNRMPLKILKTLTALTIVVLAFSFSSNPPDGNTGAPDDGTCANCHAGNNFEGSVTINGLPDIVVSGETYTIDLAVKNTDGKAIRAGFQLVSLFNGDFVKAGDFVAETSDIGVNVAGIREYVDHRGAKNFQDSVAAWIFKWEAPAVDEEKEIVMFSAAIIGNGGGSSGDAVKFADREIIVQPATSAVLEVTIMSGDLLCNGDTADLEAIVAGGKEAYTYLWSNGVTTKSNEGVGAGDYSVVVTDADSVTAMAEMTLTEPEPLAIILEVVDEVGLDAKNGGATASVTGGTEPFSYLWSNDSTSTSIDGLSGGSYSVTVVDANACSATSTFDISTFCGFAVNLEVTQVTCPGAVDGEATIEPTGFTQPLSFEWSNGESAFIAVAALAPGNYDVTVTDGTGCTIVEEFEIMDPEPLTLDFLASFPNCDDFSVNSLEVLPDGGTGMYSYLWSSGETTQVISDITAGEYSVTITDSNGCAVSDTMDVAPGDNQAPVITFTDSIAVYIDSNGFLDLSSFNIVATDNCGIMDTTLIGDISCSQAAPFTWMYQVTDLNGNITTASIFVPEILDTFAPTVICIDDIIQDGCDTIFYEIPEAMDNCNVARVELAEGLPSGSIFPKDSTKVTYNYYDDADNFTCCSFWVVTTNDLILTIDEVNDATAGEGGSIEITAGGGAGVFAYEWVMNDTAVISSFEDVTNLQPGSYIVFITDESGCTLRSEAILIELGSSTTDLSSTSSKFYPNPTDNLLIIEHTNNLSNIAVFDINGQFLKVENTRTGSQQTKLEVATLESGMYFVRLDYEDSSETIKFMKK